MHNRFSEQFKQNKIGMTGLIIYLFISILAIFAPFIAPYDPWDYSFECLQPPSIDHLLGTNDIGYDIFSELLWSLRTSIFFGLSVGAIASTIGLIIGISAAMISGLYDVIVMRIADALFAIPTIMVLILMAAYFKPSTTILIIALSLIIWQTTARGARAQTLSLKSKLHIKTARNMGGSTFYIMYRHIIPELFPLYAMGFVTKVRMAVFMEAGLSFLGIFDPTSKSLGIMMSYAMRYLYLDVWYNWLLPAVLSLSILIISLALISYAIEEILDPRLRRDNIAKN
ncbi:MAG: ABC transporter permease [ANME-2 cluster archaeon]|nr:ABC transporter permease [ANME-2 cluster archaeon]MBC2702110.1 ABC transporter permease [ANME-2 cluster archaeon]MBC2706774.1 ABC transporter permease [ANME-2 cluster archaeon]MBC2747648.1 ABC transporter permease [ANME-2 cluster archaeon]MBC2763233.1 ABC transporter permease [ANME-2 cluster archaeon]